MQSICVFLGSSPGVRPVYARAAEAMGRELAARDLTCVYGGSDTGLMKRLADSALAAGGKVVGVTVAALRDREIYHHGLTALHVVASMNERKQLMAQLSDGFVALPGGIGTFEEFFAVYSMNLLGLHAKPCGLLDIDSYYASLDTLLDNAEREGFLKFPYTDMVVRAETPAVLLDRLAAWQPPVR